MHREMGEKRSKKLRVHFFLEALEPGSFISKGNSYFFLLTPLPLWEKGKCWGGGKGGLKALPIPDCFGEHSLLGLNWCAPDS
jgi:hypothetical protein